MRETQRERETKHIATYSFTYACAHICTHTHIYIILTNNNKVMHIVNSQFFLVCNDKVE